jgi:hypothetical protein
MIAPTARCRKGAAGGALKFAGQRMVGGLSPEIRRHRIVSGIIMLPNFRPALAPLNCER